MNSNSPSKPWQLWLDTGGTFTDCLALDPGGNETRLKVLSSSVIRGTIKKQHSAHMIEVSMTWPSADIFKDFEFRMVGANQNNRIESVDITKGKIHLCHPLKGNWTGKTFEITSGEEVPVLAARLLTGTRLSADFPPLEVRLGSTRGTNAILERKGANTALLVTRGFKDLLLIGNQQRPDLFALQVIKPQPLYQYVFEVTERITSDGLVQLVLVNETVDRVISQLRKAKVDSIAIALMNSYKNPVHELALRSALVDAGFRFISLSHELSFQIKILPRAETAVANAYLAPIIQQYVHGIQSRLSGARISMMTSAGSLVPSASFHPKDSLLSGPAGGVVGAAIKATLSGKQAIITFDMGGTSTDVSLYHHRFDYRFESVVGPCRILSPSIAIETIAAGGGSLCDFDGYRFTVGPQSAGAIPGPACYGANGPLTITDVNLLLGRLDPDQFAIPMDPRRSKEALDSVLTKVKKSSGRTVSALGVLKSFISIANEKMADAIRKISIQEGHDPRHFTLLGFGGAGGQHACALASLLGMQEVLIPYDAGLLSAFGIGHAVAEKFSEKLILEPLNIFSARLPETLSSLFEEARSSMVAEGHTDNHITLAKTLIFLRFKGQDSALEIDYKPGDQLRELFEEKYKSIFGHWVDLEVEVESIRVIARAGDRATTTSLEKAKDYKPKAEKLLKNRMPVYRWEGLRSGAHIHGPALVVSSNSTTFVDEGWDWHLDVHQNALMTHRDPLESQEAHSVEAQLELFTNRFTALAQEMGAMLQRTSFSVNVKERLDFSCALLDADGFLVVNAPHIPVHLGSLGVCVRDVSKNLLMEEGDVVITNHPAFGGSHLPDVTLIKPVYFKGHRVGFVANRAHHAEIGGKKPGSMPADATRLAEEGVIIKPTYLIKAGESQWGKIRTLLTSPPYPSRALEENLADVHAALAAVNLGEQGLQQLCETYSHKVVRHYMKSIRDYASKLLLSRMKGISIKPMRAVEFLDDGSRLMVIIQKKKAQLFIDFRGSSPLHPGNLNATRAIVQSVVLYALRLFVGKPIPMNEGLMEHVKINLPLGLLNPDFSMPDLPAVVGGNTEVSQRLTDTLLKAFQMIACSQGTMNNFLFGNPRFGYYETIAGGTGAGPGFHGANGVHHHMTNTRITDPEVLEFRYPVQLVRFGLRPGSGGKGQWKGGDGVEREFIFNENLEINILSQHRVESPYGMKGGQPGKRGEQFLTRANGEKEKLKGMDSAEVMKGDRLTIRTPGGGGWGRQKK